MCRVAASCVVACCLRRPRREGAGPDRGRYRGHFQARWGLRLGGHSATGYGCSHRWITRTSHSKNRRGTTPSLRVRESHRVSSTRRGSRSANNARRPPLPPHPCACPGRGAGHFGHHTHAHTALTALHSASTSSPPTGYYGRCLARQERRSVAVDHLPSPQRGLIQRVAPQPRPAAAAMATRRSAQVCRQRGWPQWVVTSA